MAKERRDIVDTPPRAAEDEEPRKARDAPGLDETLVRRLRELYDPMLEEPVPDELLDVLKQGRRPSK